MSALLYIYTLEQFKSQTMIAHNTPLSGRRGELIYTLQTASQTCHASSSLF